MNRLGVPKELGEDSARAADSSRPKGYPISYGFTSSNRSCRKYKRKRGCWGLGCPSSQVTTAYDRAYFSWRWLITCLPWEMMNKFLLLFWWCTQLLLYLLNHLYFIPWIFVLFLFSSHSTMGQWANGFVRLNCLYLTHLIVAVQILRMMKESNTLQTCSSSLQSSLPWITYGPHLTIPKI